MQPNRRSSTPVANVTLDVVQALTSMVHRVGVRSLVQPAPREPQLAEPRHHLIVIVSRKAHAPKGLLNVHLPDGV